MFNRKKQRMDTINLTVSICFESLTDVGSVLYNQTDMELLYGGDL